MDAFERAAEVNREGAARAALEAERRRRQDRRAAEPLPVGSLFDLTTRDQRSLFEGER